MLPQRLQTSTNETFQHFEASDLQSIFGLSIGPHELMSTLSKLEALEESEGTGDERIRIGSRVRLRDLQANCDFEIEIVVPRDSAPAQGRLSVLSPLGAAIVGSPPVDTVEVRFPGRSLRFLVLEILASPSSNGTCASFDKRSG